MNETSESRVPWILWPFYAVWKILTFILEILGRILCALFGIAMMATGVAVSLSVIGAPLGIPLAAFGFLLTIRALF